MLYSENDVDFGLISDALFEELCYDLLVRLGFQSLSWRQGPHDKGRDIEGQFRSLNPLVGQYEERWFFECKNYSSGVDKSALTSATEWADVGQPDHLAMLISPHVTNQCREWLDEKQKTACYRIHLLEGKSLKALILQYDELIERYFINKIQRIFRNAFIDWIAAGIFPDSERLHIFYVAINPEFLTQEEVAFILTAHIENNFKPSSNLDTKYGEARDKFITQIIEILYSLAKPSESDIWNTQEINLHKVERLAHTEVSFQWTRLKTNSLFLSYKRDESEHTGYYHLIFKEQEPILEILFGQDVSTDTVKADIHLLQNSQETPEIVTKFEDEWKEAKSKAELKNDKYD